MSADPVKLLPVLYEATADMEQWPVFLKGLSEQVDARVATLISRDENQRLRFLAQVGADPEAERVFRSYYFEIDAFLHLSEQRGFGYPGAIFPSQAYVTDKELKATEYGNDFLLKFNLFRQCFSLFGKNGLALSNLAVIRSIREEGFGKREVRVLRFLAPHVEQAIHLNERFAQLRLESEAKSAALNQLALGVVFLDATGQVLGTNEAAMSILARNDGLVNSRGRLIASRPDEDRTLRSTIFKSCQTGASRGTGAGGALLISRRPPATPLQVVVGPSCGSMSALSSCPAAVVFIHDISARIRPRTEILQGLYGLTPAEARVTCLLLDGKSSEEIGSLLCRSKNTLKTQMQSIFRKTGVCRQSELLRSLMYLPVEAREHRRPL